MTGRLDDPWLLSIDFGTTATASAMTVGHGEEVVDIDNAPRMPSMVCWKEPSNGTPGRLLLGDAAENEAVLAPQCVERSPKRKIAQEFILLGSERVRVTEAVGQIFRHVLEEAVPVHGGRSPDELRVTHPARWGDGRLAKLRAAAAFAGFEDPLLVPEPIGAAVYFATKQLLPDDHVAVYDLGGGTFDTAILRRTERGFEVIGEPGGRDDLGGEDFDDRLYRFLGRRLDPEQWQTLIAPDSGRSWQRAHYDFKQTIRRAKEHLSRYPDATVRTPIPDGEDIQISRTQFEGLIRDDIESTVDELKRTVEASGQSVDDLAAIYLAGGSSRIPLISRRIEERLGKRPSTLGDPKAVIALGAVRAQLRTSPEPATQTRAETASDNAPPSDVTTARDVSTPSEISSTPRDISTPRDTPRWSATDPGLTSRKREPPDRVTALGGAVALLGAVVVILSEFLHRRENENLWQHHSTIRYPIIVTILALLVIFLLATGLRRARPTLLLVATLVAAFLTAALSPLVIHGYSHVFQIGVWIGILGGVLAMAGSGIAARGDLRPAQVSARAELTSTRAADWVAGLGLIVLIGSLLLTRRGDSITWDKLSRVPLIYPLTVTVLSAVGVWLVTLELRGRRRTLGLTAVLSCFLLGQAVNLTLRDFDGLKIGFWMGILGAMIAVVASAGTTIARSRARERSLVFRPPGNG